MNEIAERSLDRTTIEQAFEAARVYRELKLICPWCCKAVLGAEFGKHAEMHEGKPVDDPVCFFEDLLSKHGNSPKALGWSENGQRQRFEVLKSVGIDHSSTVLDVGCGLGHFLDYLESRGVEDLGIAGYVGVDISEKMIEQARELHRGFNTRSCFMVKDVMRFGATLPVTEYVVSSGMLNVGQYNCHHMQGFMRSCFEACRIGAAINMLSVRASNHRADRCYYYPHTIFSLAQAITPYVSLRHDYRENDFTVFLYRDPQ